MTHLFFLGRQYWRPLAARFVRRWGCTRQRSCFYWWFIQALGIQPGFRRLWLRYFSMYAHNPKTTHPVRGTQLKDAVKFDNKLRNKLYSHLKICWNWEECDPEDNYERRRAQWVLNTHASVILALRWWLNILIFCLVGGTQLFWGLEKSHRTRRAPQEFPSGGK